MAQQSEIISIKNCLRHLIREKRQQFSQQEKSKAAKTIASKLFREKHFLNAQTILLYSALAEEVPTEEIITKCLAEGKRVVLPRVKDDKIILSQIKDNKSLEKSTLGIFEPSLNNFVPVNLEEIEVGVIPGIVFDLNKNRIGFGKGYYDRFLEGVRKKGKIYLIGLAFDLQIVEKIPTSNFDVKMDKVITEKREF